MSPFPTRRPDLQTQDAAVAEMDRQAAEQDFIAQQQKEQARMQQMQEEAAREAARAQKAALANAKRQGVKIAPDATGAESIQRHPDGQPVYEAGFVGEPQITDQGGSVAYRDARGQRYDVPFDAIRSEPDPTGETFYSFDVTGPDGQKQTMRQPAGTKPLFRVDPGTGSRIVDVTDPTTGSVQPRIVGVDPLVANKAAIEKRKNAAQLAQNERSGAAEELRLQLAQKDTLLQPVRQKLRDAQEAADKLAKEKSTYEQTADGFYAVTTLGEGVEPMRRKVDSPAEIAKADAWVKNRAMTEKALAEAKAAHDPAAAEIQAMQERRDALALETLKENRRAQAEIRRMEEAAKAGRDVTKPDWQARADSFASDPRLADLSTVADMEATGDPLAPEVQRAALPETAKLMQQVWQAGFQGQPQERPSLLQTMLNGVTALKPAAKPQNTAEAQTLAAKALGITDPANVNVTANALGYYELRYGDDEFASYEPDRNRITIISTAGGLHERAADLIANADKDGVPVYLSNTYPAKAEQPFTAAELRDLLVQGVDAVRSADSQDTAEAALAQAGLAPNDIRGMVRSGKLSVQDGRMMLDKFHGVEAINYSRAAIEQELGRVLATSKTAKADWEAGNKAAVINRVLDGVASKATSGNVVVDRGVLEQRRQELLSQHVKEGTASKVGGFMKELIMPMVGIGGQALAYVPQKLAKWTGYETEAGRLSEQQFEDWLKRTGSFIHKMRTRDDVQNSLAELRSWAQTANPGDAPPDDLADKIAGIAYDGYHELTDDAAKALNTSRNTFNVNRDPMLRAALDRYLRTADPAAFEQLSSLLMLDGQDRKTQAEVSAYISAPRVASAGDVIGRAKGLNIELTPDQAGALIGISRVLNRTEDQKAAQKLIAEAGKIMGLEGQEAAETLARVTADETDDPDSAWGLLKGGFVAGRQELLTEVASTAAEAGLAWVTAGAATPEIIAERAARQGIKTGIRAAIRRNAQAAFTKLADSSTAFAKTAAALGKAREVVGTGLANMGEAFAKAGIKPATFGQPLTRADKVRNAVVQVGKNAAAAAPMEALEEGVAAIGEPDPNAASIGEQMLMGAAGGLVLTPMFAGAAAVGQAWKNRGAGAEWEAKKTGYIDELNRRMESVPGFKPLTVADFDAWQGLQDNPAQAQARQTMLDAMRGHEAAVTEWFNANAGNPQAPLSPAVLAAQANVERAGKELELATSSAFMAMDELRGIPEAERPLYTAAAKAATGARDFTEAEAKALMAQGGNNAVVFQQAQVMPADVAGPPAQRGISAPAVSNVAPGVYRLPAGVRVDVPPALLESLTQKAPTMVDLLRQPANQTPAVQAVVAKADAKKQAMPKTPKGKKAKPATTNATTPTTPKQDAGPLPVGTGNATGTPAQQSANPTPSPVAPEPGKPGSRETAPTTGQREPVTPSIETPIDNAPAPLPQDLDAKLAALTKGGSVSFSKAEKDTVNASWGEASPFNVPEAFKKGKTAKSARDLPMGSRIDDDTPVAKEEVLFIVEAIAEAEMQRRNTLAKRRLVVIGGHVANDGGAGYFWDTDTVAVNPQRLARMVWAEMLNAGKAPTRRLVAEQARGVITHEIVHAAQFEAARLAYSKIKGDKPAFEEWVKGYYEAIWNSLNPEQQQATIAAYGTILANAPEWHRGAEASRMLLETGTMERMSEAIIRHLENVLAVLKRWYDDVVNGKADNAIVADEIERVQAVLDAWNSGGTVKPDAKEKPAKASIPDQKPAAKVNTPKSSTGQTSKPADSAPEMSTSDQNLTEPTRISRIRFERTATATRSIQGGVSGYYVFGEGLDVGVWIRTDSESAAIREAYDRHIAGKTFPPSQAIPPATTQTADVQDQTKAQGQRQTQEVLTPASPETAPRESELSNPDMGSAGAVDGFSLGDGVMWRGAPYVVVSTEQAPDLIQIESTEGSSYPVRPGELQRYDAPQEVQQQAFLRAAQQHNESFNRLFHKGGKPKKGTTQAQVDKHNQRGRLLQEWQNKIAPAIWRGTATNGTPAAILYRTPAGEYAVQIGKDQTIMPAANTARMSGLTKNQLEALPDNPATPKVKTRPDLDNPAVQEGDWIMDANGSAGPVIGFDNGTPIMGMEGANAGDVEPQTAQGGWKLAPQSEIPQIQEPVSPPANAQSDGLRVKLMGVWYIKQGGQWFKEADMMPVSMESSTLQAIEKQLASQNSSKPAEPSREEWQKTYAKFKRALAKAVKAKDYAEIIRQADAFQKHYEADGNGPFPDTWSDWERHKADAEMQLARQGAATNPLVVPILKPVTPPRPAERVDDAYANAQAATRAALGGLFSAPVRRAIPQLEVPRERFDAIRTAAEAILEANIRTPEAFARFMDDTFPGGKARPYSEAIWDMLGIVDKSLRGSHDWTRIYGDIEQPLPDVQEPAIDETPAIPQTTTTDETPAQPRQPDQPGIRPIGDVADAPEQTGQAGGTGRDNQRPQIQPDNLPPAGEGGNLGEMGLPDVRQGGGNLPQEQQSTRGQEPSNDGPATSDGGEGSGMAGGERTPQHSPGRDNYQLTDPESIVGGGPKARFQKNKAALELLDILETENREPTPAELNALAAYTGWGALGQELFQGSFENYAGTPEWREEAMWLRDRLGKDDWTSAQDSILNAHYTDPPTVTAMWDMIRRMGFTGGRVLEPSEGIGNVWSLMPRDLMANSQLTGIEMDPTTAAIAKMLHPRVNHRTMPYQKSTTSDNFYDVILGNWPFSNNDKPADRRWDHLEATVHNFFFIKALAQVRPGGLVVGITSTGTMDAKSSRIRKYLAARGELVAAFRLPSGAFGKYAGTKVVTDLIILRKREKELETDAADQGWVNSVEHPEFDFNINEYYLKNPSHVLGKLAFGHGTTSGRPGMIVERSADYDQVLARLPERLPEGAFLPWNGDDMRDRVINNTTKESRQNTVVEQSGELYTVNGESLTPLDAETRWKTKTQKTNDKRLAEARALIALRDAFTSLMRAYQSQQDATAPRAALKAAYEAFRAAHGNLSDSFMLDKFEKAGDPYALDLRALVELRDGIETPRAIMERDILRAPKLDTKGNIADAYAAQRANSPVFDAQEVAKLAGVTAQDVIDFLSRTGTVFKTPTGVWEPGEIYLSGNVRRKLREAEAAKAEGVEGMDANIEALRKIVPADVPYYAITTQMGVAWIPLSDYTQFIQEKLNGRPQDIRVSKVSGGYNVRIEGRTADSTEARNTYNVVDDRGEDHLTPSRIFQAAMNGTALEVKVETRNAQNEKIFVVDEALTKRAMALRDRIRNEFARWVWEDEARAARLSYEYNEAMNSVVNAKFDGGHLTMPGLALSLGKGSFDLRKHQLDAIWRGIVNRKGVYAHEVGTGKTFTMAGIAIEGKRQGRHRKPLLFAHNANSAAVAADFRRAYPGARILYLDSLSPSERDLRLRQIASDDWDAVIVPHSLIDRFGLKADTLYALARGELDALESEFWEAAGEIGITRGSLDLNDSKRVSIAINNARGADKNLKRTAKELASARRRIVTRIEKQISQFSKPGTVFFEDMGIDAIMVDEAHVFKKIALATRKQIKGLNKTESGKGFQLGLLTDYLKRENNGNGVHLFTGTPVTNTLNEVFNMMRFVMHDEMSEQSIENFDDWYNSYAKGVTDIEPTSGGTWEAVERLRAFLNIPELARLAGQVFDVVRAKDMPEFLPRPSEDGFIPEGQEPIGRPSKTVRPVVIEPPPIQKRVMSWIRQRFAVYRDLPNRIRGMLKKMGGDAPNLMDIDGKNAALDPRLVDPSAEDDPNSKVNTAISRVLEHYSEHPNATQMIFLERGANDFTTAEVTIYGPDGPIYDNDGNKQTRKETRKQFNILRDMVEKLVAQGVKPEEIAVFHNLSLLPLPDGREDVLKKVRRVSAATPKDEIAAMMNRGEVRIAFGGTETMGTGVNAQTWLRAMHHLDVPWMPGELEQRNGRGHRQGNRWNTVFEYRYTMEGTHDGKMWSTLLNKVRFIERFTEMLQGRGLERTLEGEGADASEADDEASASDFEQMFSKAAGDPRILLRVKMERDLEKLRNDKQIHYGFIEQARRKAEQLENDIPRQEATAARLEADFNQFKTGTAGGFSATLRDKTFTERAEFDEAMKRLPTFRDRTKIGSFAGFDLYIVPVIIGQAFELVGPNMGSRDGYMMNTASAASMEGVLRGLGKRAANLRDGVEKSRADVAKLRAKMNEPFPAEKTLADQEKAYAVLVREIVASPTPAPGWLRYGAPAGSLIYLRENGRLIPKDVMAHRWDANGYWILVDMNGEMTPVRYTDAFTDEGRAMFEEQEFTEPPQITVNQDSEAGGQSYPGVEQSLMDEFGSRLVIDNGQVLRVPRWNIPPPTVENGYYDRPAPSASEFIPNTVADIHQLMRDAGERRPETWEFAAPGKLPSFDDGLYEPRDTWRMFAPGGWIIGEGDSPNQAFMNAANHDQNGDQIREIIRFAVRRGSSKPTVRNDPTRLLDVPQMQRGLFRRREKLRSLIEKTQKRLDDLEDDPPVTGADYRNGILSERLNNLEKELGTVEGLLMQAYTSGEEMRLSSAPAPTMPRDRAEAIVRNLTGKEQAGKLNPKERAALEEARARLEQDDNGFDPGGNVPRQPAGPRSGGPMNLASAPVRTLPEAPFYSKLSRVVSDKMPNRADVATIKGIISNTQTGIKAEEIKWSGILPWLDAQEGMVTKQAVLDYLASDGAVRLEEVRIGSANITWTRKPGSTWGQWEGSDGAVLNHKSFTGKGANQQSWWLLKTASGEESTFSADHELQAQQYAQKWLNGRAKFAQYQLPGGENYREVVLAMPHNQTELPEGFTLENSPAALKKWEVYGPGYGRYASGQTKEEAIASFWDKHGASFGKASYTSSHFPDVPNYVAHARLNDRVDAEGRPGTFIEEIQSDRHQAGREEGYREDAVFKVVPDGIGGYAVVDQAGKSVVDRETNMLISADTPEEAMSIANTRGRVFGGEGVPDAPFRKDWPLQMFKRALAEAVAQGKQWIGWTTGETQAERYDLSKQLCRISYEPNEDGTFDFEAYPLNDDLNPVISESDIDLKRIEELAGKEVAKKVEAREGDKDKDGYRDWHHLRGLNLRVGGEGMKGFYDTILPKEIGKYVKQWGAGVVKGEINRPVYAAANLEPDIFGDLEPSENAKPESQLAAPIWRVDITPQMKSGVESGQALFSAPIRKAKPAQDAEYMAAVEAGDMEKAQRMVDEAAKAAGYNVGPVWHAGDFNPSEDPELFSWSHFGSKQAAQARVDETGNDNATFTQAYLKGRFLQMPDLGTWGLLDIVRNLPTNTLTQEEVQDVFELVRSGSMGDDWSELARLLTKKGFDGIKYVNAVEDKGSTSYLMFLPSSAKIADAVTRDTSGNIIPLSQRFNPQSDSILRSAPAPKKPNRATQAMRDIIEALPPPHREVLRDLLVNGMSIEDAATTHNLSETAVGNILRRGEAHIRLMLDRAPTKPTVQVQDGIVKATDGRPDLAMSGNAAVAAVDQRRMTPEEVTHAEMQELATRLFDVAPAEAESLVVRWMDSGTTVLSTDGMPDSIKAIVADAQARNAAEMMMTAAAKMLVARKTLEGGNSTHLARLIYLYRNTGTEQARALGMRRDPFDTPEERAAMYLSEALLTPPDAIKNELRRNPANRDRILAAWAKRADEIKAEMLAHGIDLDATFADHAEEQKLVEETIPKPVKPVLARAPKKTRQLVKAIMQGMTPAEAIRAAGLTAKAAFRAYQEFRATLNQTGTEAAQAMRDQLLRSAPAPGADFAANLGLPDLTEAEWLDAVQNNKPLRTTPETEKLKQHREKAKKAGTLNLKNSNSTRKAIRAIEERKSNAFEKISEFWRASILSGPQTHVVNLVSGLTYGAYEASFKKLAAGVQGDIARMFGAKPDAASLADIPAMIAASLPSIKLAFLDGIAAWKSETRAFENYALQLRDDNGELFKEQFNPALKGTLGKVMRGISFRLMGAADEFVKSFFTRIEVAAQARQIARNEGKTGHELAKAIQELMEPGSLAWERALGQAKKITFQTEIGSGSAAIDAIDGLAQLISRTKKGDFGKPLKGLAHFTFPFVDTPTNIFKAGVTMSPVGGLLALVDMIRAYNRYRKGNAEEAAKIYNAARALDDLTNQIVAWGFILGLSHLVKPGDDEDETPYITGTIPWRSTSPGERELAYRTAPPQSIRIGDRWISYKRLDPFASALAFTVDAIKEFQSGKPIDEVWTKIGLGMMRNMQDKTFLQGVSDVVNAVQDPERFGTKWATNIATGFIPNLIRQPIRTYDDVFRETDLPNDLGFWDALGRRMGYGIWPMAAMPSITVWGEPARKDTGTGGPNTDWLLRLLSPADMRAANVDMLDVALLRYNMTHQDGDPRALFGVTAPSRELQRTIGGQVIKISLDDAEYEDFITKSGKAARQAIGTTYEGRDLTEQDVDRIKDILSRAHETFRNAAFVQAVQKRGGLNALANTTK